LSPWAREIAPQSLPLTRVKRSAAVRLVLDIKEVLGDPTLINAIMARGELPGVFATVMTWAFHFSI